MIFSGEGEGEVDMMKQYEDLLANVRWDGRYHSVRQLIKPNTPIIQEIANTLIQQGNFVANCQNLVNNYTKYTDEIGDYWSTPTELIKNPSGDCDCKSILLASLLRNFYDANSVYCTVGIWHHDGKPGGHMWVMLWDKNNRPRIVEATAAANRPLYGRYDACALFNDEYALASDFGLKEFDLIPVPLGVKIDPQIVAP